MSGVTEVSAKFVPNSRENDLPNGYKHTLLGLIPIEWNCESLGDLCSLKSGLGITSKSINETGEYPCYGGNGLRGYTSQFTHEGDYALIGRQGALCGNIQYLTGKFFASEHALVASPFDRVDPKWLAIYLESMNLNQYSESSAQPGLSAEKLRVLNLITPTFAEQTAIANALSDVDALIQELEKLIAKKQAIKTATMQQLLTGRTRLPQFANHPDGRKKGYKPSELGEIPEDWDIKCIRNVIDNERGVRYGIVQPGKYDANGRLMVRGQDYSKGWVNEHDIFRVSDAVEYRYKNARLKAGDLIITIVGAGTGHVEIVPSWLDGANLTQTTARMTINPNLANSRFVRAALLSTDGQARIASFIKGNAQPGLNCFDIYGFEFVSPLDVNEQNAVAEIVSDMDKDIQSLEIRLGKTRKIKQGMMQELLTGKTRLVKPAGAAE